VCVRGMASKKKQRRVTAERGIYRISARSECQRAGGNLFSGFVGIHYGYGSVIPYLSLPHPFSRRHLARSIKVDYDEAFSDFPAII
jgi:hypothetical protein